MVPKRQARLLADRRLLEQRLERLLGLQRVTEVGHPRDLAALPAFRLCARHDPAITGGESLRPATFRVSFRSPLDARDHRHTTSAFILLIFERK